MFQALRPSIGGSFGCYGGYSVSKLASPRRGEGDKRESKSGVDTLIAALHDSHSDKEATVRLEKLMGELRPETVNSRDQYGRTALMGVARWGTTQQVDNCLKMGADPMLCDRSRFSVLHYMARRKEKPSPQQVSNMVDLLIAANAEPHAPSKCGETPLQLAVRGNAHPDVARELVEKILGCSAQPSVASCSVTHPPSTARMSESSLALRDLIQRAFEKGGYPAGVVEQALSDGADINTRDLHGRTALLLCARYGSPDDLRKLVEKHQAEVLQCDNLGNTALHYCVRPRGKPGLETVQHQEDMIKYVCHPVTHDAPVVLCMPA